VRFWANNIKYDQSGCPIFHVMDGEKEQAQIHLPIPGQYSMLNALAVFAAGCELGISPTVIAKSLTNVKGVKRRYEYKGSYNGANIVDDYAHHPNEIRACLAAARMGTSGRIICLFQPHTYSRTKNHLSDFAEALTNADEIILLPIFPAREPFDSSISSLDLSYAIKRLGGNVIHIDDFDTARKYLQQKLMPSDLLITMGAGDVYFVGEQVLIN